MVEVLKRRPIPRPLALDDGALLALQMLIDEVEGMRGRFQQWITGDLLAHGIIRQEHITIEGGEFPVQDGNTHTVVEDADLMHVNPTDGVLTHREWDATADGYQPPCAYICILDGDTHDVGTDANLIHWNTTTRVLTHRAYNQGTDGDTAPCGFTGCPYGVGGVVSGNTHTYATDTHVLYINPATGVITHRLHHAATDGNLPPCDYVPVFQ